MAGLKFNLTMVYNKNQITIRCLKLCVYNIVKIFYIPVSGSTSQQEMMKNNIANPGSSKVESGINVLSVSLAGRICQGFNEIHQFSVVVIYYSANIVKIHCGPVFRGITFPLWK